MPSKQSPSDSAVKPTDLDTTDSTSTSKRSPRHPCPPQRPTATVFEVMLGMGGTDALSRQGRRDRRADPHGRKHGASHGLRLWLRCDRRVARHVLVVIAMEQPSVSGQLCGDRRLCRTDRGDPVTGAGDVRAMMTLVAGADPEQTEDW
jgi:hypothetical protein